MYQSVLSDAFFHNLSSFLLKQWIPLSLTCGGFKKRKNTSWSPLYHAKIHTPKLVKYWGHNDEQGICVLCLYSSYSQMEHRPVSLNNKQTNKNSMLC